MGLVEQGITPTHIFMLHLTDGYCPVGRKHVQYHGLSPAFPCDGTTGSAALAEAARPRLRCRERRQPTPRASTLGSPRLRCSERARRSETVRRQATP